MTCELLTPNRLSSLARRRQRGQAATELVVAAALLLPLFVGLVYVARYVDIKQSTVQASRYAAWERAVDPAGKRTDEDLANEVRTRFFANGQRQGGALNSVNFVAGVPAKGDAQPFWTTLHGRPLVANFTDVTVSTARHGTPGKLTNLLSGPATSLLKLPKNGLFSVDVEVSLERTTGFAPLDGADVRMGSTTAVLGETWGADGSEQVKKRIRPTIPAQYVGDMLKPLTYLFSKFESAFKDFSFGCINPDVVPKDRLQPYRPNGYCK